MTVKDNLPFSKRYGFEPIEAPFQITDIDSSLRIDLWNAFYIFVYNRLNEVDSMQKSDCRHFHMLLWIHPLKQPIDDFPYHNSEFSDFVRKYIENEIWYKVYNFFEYVLRSLKGLDQYEYKTFENFINTKLRNNNSGYRLASNKFIPITNESEISELKQTGDLAEKHGLSGIQKHLTSSIALLSQKPNPDFRNSIKESISMVENISRIIEPGENTLGKALNKLDRGHKINKTLKEGFEKLYAYTNDKNGIRHALMDDTTVDFEEAKFFLISCSAFTNYLIEKAKKSGLLK